MEADSTGETSTPTSKRNDGQPDVQQQDLTPIEWVFRVEDVSEFTDSPTVQRAVSLSENMNMTKWGTRCRKAIVLKPADNPKI